MERELIFEQEGQSDEPPEPPSISYCWLRRMVALTKKNFGLCERRENNSRFNYIFRKSFGIMGFAEFYPQQ